MGLQHQRNRPTDSHGTLQDSRTTRFGLPIRHPALWHFLLDQLVLAANRIHRYRALSARAVEDTINEIDCGRCL